MNLFSTLTFHDISMSRHCWVFGKTKTVPLQRTHVFFRQGSYDAWMLREITKREFCVNLAPPCRARTTCDHPLLIWNPLMMTKLLFFGKDILSWRIQASNEGNKGVQVGIWKYIFYICMLLYIFPAGISWLAKSGAQFNGSDEIDTDETVQVHPPAVFWTREIWEVLKTLYGESCFTAYTYCTYIYMIFPCW